MHTGGEDDDLEFARQVYSWSNSLLEKREGDLRVCSRAAKRREVERVPREKGEEGLTEWKVRTHSIFHADMNQIACQSLRMEKKPKGGNCQLEISMNNTESQRQGRRKNGSPLMLFSQTTMHQTEAPSHSAG